MSAFAAAAAAITADANMGVDATYTPASGSPATVRIVLSAPDMLDPMSAASAVVADAVIHVPRAALTSPAERDILAVGGVSYEVLGVMQDAEGVTWRLACRRITASGAADTLLGAAAA